MTNLFLFTFNCAKIDQSKSGFESHLTKALPSQCPDLLVFGFQELVPIIESTSYSAVDPYLNELRIKIQHLVSTNYFGNNTTVEVVAHDHIGAIGAFVLTPHQRDVGKVASASASCGMFFSSLKGAVGLRLKYKVEDFTFITAHLSANEGNVARRNEDYWRLVTSMHFGDGYSVFKPHSHTFFMGDLNYRARHYDSESLESEALLNNDELVGVVESGDAFVGMQEADISFKPTYKYHVSTKIYNDKRIPSWCDRILFQSYASNKHEVLKYCSLPDVKSSDHEPVYLQIEVTGLPQEVINEDGTLLVDGRDLKTSKVSQYENYLRVGADVLVGTSVYCATTTNGRLTTVGVLVLIVLVKWFLF